LPPLAETHGALNGGATDQNLFYHHFLGENLSARGMAGRKVLALETLNESLDKRVL
jgi:hypothetical protein